MSPTSSSTYKGKGRRPAKKSAAPENAGNAQAAGPDNKTAKDNAGVSLLSGSSLPKVALLGRPNVGKSTLFNRLIRSKRAITHDEPGITRDRMEGWVRPARDAGGQPFILVDTGGITLDAHAAVTEGPAGIRGFEAAILEQAKEAMQEAALLCLVVDAREGLTPLDAHLADFLRKSGKPLIVIANKVDGPEKADLLLAEFHALGLPMHPVSAEHGFNVRLLEDEIQSLLPEAEAEPEMDDRDQEEAAELEVAAGDDSEEERFYEPLPEIFTELSLERAEREAAEREAQEARGAGSAAGKNGGRGPGISFLSDLSDQPLRLAMLGRPNVGKSSLVNALIGKERMIVSPEPGATRDSVDVPWENEGFLCTLVDSAGVRRPSRVVNTVERYSVNASLKSSSKAEVTLLVLDASEGLTQQDKRLLALLDERKTPFMVLVNKCDLIPAKNLKAAEAEYRAAMTFCQHVPLLMVSARDGKNLKRITRLAGQIRQEGQIRISTARLNRTIAELVGRKQPPMVKNLRPKFYYVTQAENTPPTIVCFVNDPERILPAYARYLERSLRAELGLRAAPMRLRFRPAHAGKKGKKTKK